MEGKRILSIRIGSLLLITDKMLSRAMIRASASSYFARDSMLITSDLEVFNNNKPVTNKSGAA